MSEPIFFFFFAYFLSAQPHFISSISSVTLEQLMDSLELGN